MPDRLGGRLDVSQRAMAVAARFQPKHVLAHLKNELSLPAAVFSFSNSASRPGRLTQL